MTERLFDILRSQHIGYVIAGPERAGKTCLWVRYSKTTRNRIDLLISLLSTTVRYLLSVWLDTTQTEAVHRKMTVLASTGRLLKKFSVMLIAIGCHALKSSA